MAVLLPSALRSLSVPALVCTGRSPAVTARAEAAPLGRQRSHPAHGRVNAGRITRWQDHPLAGSLCRNPTRGAGSSLYVLGGWAVTSGVLSLAPCCILQRITERSSQTVSREFGGSTEETTHVLKGRVMSTCEFCSTQNFVCIPMPYMSRICFQ